jgi:hypothetical protein
MPDASVDSNSVPLAHWRIPAFAHCAASLAILAVSGASLRYFYSHGLSNLYGDGLAHMEGARRIFDSVTPGYQEIGSVWLPLYHLICAPLALNDFLWRSGLAGGIVSSAAFALTCYFLFRLGAEMNQNVAAGLAAVSGVLLCPSFLYLASTPLTEPLAILWLTLVVYALFRYTLSGSWKALTGAAVAAVLGTLTRYDMWTVLPFATALVLIISPCAWRLRVLRAAFFAGIAGAGPLAWMIHNAHRFGNPLEFYNGFGSALDIYAHQLATTAFAYPTAGSLTISARYYLEDLKLVIGAGSLILAVMGVVAWCAELRGSRRAAAALLLIVPLPFYIQAMAHSAVPLYVPTLFPHTYYNLRYGMEMIAATALFPSFVFVPHMGRRLRLAMLVIFLAVLGGQFLRLTSGGAQEMPIVKESVLNTPCRSPMQQAIIAYLRAHYDGKHILVAAGKWPCVMPEVGIDFRNTLSNNNRPYWVKMQTEPQKWVQWIIRGEGDDVDRLMRSYPHAFSDFEIVDQGQFPGEGGYAIYRLRAK